MAQTIKFDAYLGAHRTGQSIGCTIYQGDGTTVHATFSTTGWYEAPSGSGDFHHAGLSLPDAGGVVAVGISGTEYKRASIGAALPTSTEIANSVLAKIVTGSKTMSDVLRNIWSVTVGKATSDSASNPTSITYKDASDTVDVTHDLTDTERTPS